MKSCSRIVALLLVFLSIGYEVVGQDTLKRRQQYLEEVLQINIDQRFRANTRRVSIADSTWRDWLHRTGELPPDFATMRSIPFLPEPLVRYENGREEPITTEEHWQEKREWIKEQYQYWVSGHFPPAPGNLLATILSDTVSRDVRIQLIQLTFGPERQAKMTLELMIPQGEPGNDRPVFMTQWNHRDWAQLAVKRGYIGCVYAGADLKDDTDAYMYLYPDYDFTGLARRAWGASRVIDYLWTREEVNKKQIAITGHSRNGKQSLWAAAFDDRIAAVVSSSSSTGGDMPWRYCDPQYASETLDYVVAWNGHWFHPRLNFFSGRENKLPVDQNLLATLIAPRALLFHYSIVEPGLNSWSIEQNYYSVKKVYDFLGVPDHIGVHTRMGGHLPVPARDVEQTIDFLDGHFGRRPLQWTNHLYFTYDYDSWEREHATEREQAPNVSVIQLKDHYAEPADFERDRQEIKASLDWLLGEEPPGVRAVDVGSWDRPQHDWIEGTNPRPVVEGARAVYISPYAAIGDAISGVLYCPVDTSGALRLQENGKLPVVIYAHQYAYSSGFSKGYDKDGRKGTTELFSELVDKGFAVLAIDMFGFGTRIEEAKNFYIRHPNWSKMGKMVRDLRSCIDAVEDIDYLDTAHIYLLGNSIGGAASLFTAALDNRVAGVATVAAFSPWRTSNSNFESLKTYSHLHGSIPRLGFFAARPETVPVDFGEIIAAAAPTPLLVIAPTLDHHTDHAALNKMMETVKGVYGLYGKQKLLALRYPKDINRLSRDMYGEVSNFFLQLLDVGRQQTGLDTPHADGLDFSANYKITKHFDESSNTHYYLTRIKNKDQKGNLIRLQHAIATKPEGEAVRVFAVRKNTTLAFNASMGIKNPPPGTRQPVGIQIVDGAIVQEQPARTYTLGIRDNNELVAYRPGTTAKEIVDDGTENALTAFVPLVENHEPVSADVLKLVGNLAVKHPRQVIAQFDNLDLLFLSCGGRGYDGDGMTAEDLMRILAQLEVRFAFNLDGGGSVSTVIGDHLITKKIDEHGTKERPRPNFLFVMDGGQETNF